MATGCGQPLFACDRDIVTPGLCHFFLLPREIRDEIYTQYCYSVPRSNGPLGGYVEIPSPAPLRVCRRMRAEMAPIFLESLAHNVVHDRACLQIGHRISPKPPLYVGWNIWEYDSDTLTPVLKITVWVRKSDGESRNAAWWVEAKTLTSIRESIKWETPQALRDGMIAFKQLARALERLAAVLPKDENLSAARSRLYVVINTIRCTLREAEEKLAMSLWQGFQIAIHRESTS